MSSDTTTPSMNKSESRATVDAARHPPGELGGKEQGLQVVCGRGGGEQPSSSQSIMQEASKRLSLSPLGVTISRDFTSSSTITETDGEDSSITVAVRVRPFSQREVRLGAKQAVRMHGNETIITSREGVVHRFNYDHCFWSFDHTQSEFSNQRAVFVSLARPLLDSSFEGYNTCLFAYGQTGSGKSYCIMGEGEEVGVVPQFCQELFDRVTGSVIEQVSYKVQVSYYEIYNEKIYDLLASTSKKNKTRLRVREHPVMGPYVEDLSTYVASSYKDIEHWINMGNRFRAMAATGMNDRSSRSHSVFTIMLTQTSVLEGEEHSKVSRINLIDLAGSERSSVSHTSGERLKEGASINRSLHTLGKVISLLSEKSTGRRRKVYIPYRDSTLTWLLKESLGGNSKTAMIATISPADLHHGESLSTLRYAHQTRTIINVARINEDPNARIIRDLRDEIYLLRQQIGAPLDPNTSSASQQEIRELREKLRESEKLLTESTRTWQERLTETEKRKKEELEKLKRAGTLKVDNRRPNLVNLNEDPQLSEMLLYILKDGMSTVGRAGSLSHDIQLTGVLVAEDHCSIVYQDDRVVIEPSASPDAQTFVNGSVITETTTLHHGDRVVFGGDHFFRFNHPLEVERGGGAKGGEQGEHGFEFAKNELIRVQTEKITAEQECRMREVEEFMESQRREYETRLQELGMKMEGQSMELSMVQQSREETKERVEELTKKYNQLEQENMEQKHLLQLEKLKTEKEQEDITEQKTRLMTELEREKDKLERDIQQLNTNRHMREKSAISTLHPHSVAGEASLLKGSELVRLSMKLQEATIISKSLGKPLTFSRDESVSHENKESEVCVRVSNTQLSQVTYWDLDKFESRLEQMRELYVAQSHVPSSTASTSSLELAESVVSTGSEEADPFHDPSDVWYHDNLATPRSSPQRRLVRAYSAASTRSSTPATNPLSVRRVLDLTASIPRNHNELLSMSKGDSPGVSSLFSRVSLSQSLPRLCQDRVSRILSQKEVKVVTVFHRALQCVVEMIMFTHELEEAYFSYTPSQNLSVPLSETTEVRTLTLQLYVSLEQLLCHAHSLFALCHMLSHVTGSGSGTDGRSLVEETCNQLLNSLSHQTALYCSRLFANTDIERPGGSDTSGTTDSVQESCYNLRESLDHVVCVLGRLALSWRVMEVRMKEREEGEEGGRGLPCNAPSWVVGDSLKTFLDDQQNKGLSLTFYRGHSEWTRLCLENSCYSIQQSLSSLQPALNAHEGVSEVASSVVQLMSLITSFLQALASIQGNMWRVEEEVDELTIVDDIIPSTEAVINMLLHLAEVESAISSLCSHTTMLTTSSSPSSQHLLPSTKTLGAEFNKLAATTQAVLRSCSLESVQEMMAMVQRLAQDTGRGVKSLLTLLKAHPGQIQSVPAPSTATGSEPSHSHTSGAARAARDGPQNGVQEVPPVDAYREADDDYV